MRNRSYIKSAIYLIPLALLLVILIGCQTQQPVFPQHSPELSWPRDANQARFKYVGELKQAADLKPLKSWWARLGTFIFGNNGPRPLYGPRGILVLNNQIAWIADPGGRCLHMFDLQRRIYKRLLSVQSAGGKVITFNAPVGLCEGPDGTFFVCDSGNAGVYHFTAQGSYLGAFYLSNDVDRPTAMCYLKSQRHLYILDTANHDIKVYDLDGKLKRTISKRGVRPGEFNFPVDLTYDGEMLWVADAGNGRVQALKTDGTPVKLIGQFGRKSGNFSLPKGIALDSKKNVYVVDSRFENIQIFNQNGQLLMHIGHEGNGPGEFSLPAGIFIDSDDRIWVCDSYNHRIQLFEPIKEIHENAEH